MAALLRDTCLPTFCIHYIVLHSSITLFYPDFNLVLRYSSSCIVVEYQRQGCWETLACLHFKYTTLYYIQVLLYYTPTSSCYSGILAVILYWNTEAGLLGDTFLPTFCIHHIILHSSIPESYPDFWLTLCLLDLVLCLFALF